MPRRVLEYWFDDWLWRLDSNSNAVALTFDDGPAAKTTPRLLEALARLEIRSTMFLSGERIAGNEALVREIASAGHSIANHGFRHESLLYRSPRHVEETARRTLDAIAHCGVTPCSWFRPPYGSFNPWTGRALRRVELKGAIWSVMIPDWEPYPSERLTRQLTQRLHNGAIVVLHDGHGWSSSSEDLLKVLAEFVHRADWRFTLLP
jgi:peptidoglycan/xylan/chitin deacetylase (PgdA/CDA1 family)